MFNNPNRNSPTRGRFWGSNLASPGSRTYSRRFKPSEARLLNHKRPISSIKNRDLQSSWPIFSKEKSRSVQVNSQLEKIEVFSLENKKQDLNLDLAPSVFNDFSLWNQKTNLPETQLLLGNKFFDFSTFLDLKGFFIKSSEVWDSLDVSVENSKRFSKDVNKSRSDFCLESLEKFNSVFVKKFSNKTNLSETLENNNTVLNSDLDSDSVSLSVTNSQESTSFGQIIQILLSGTAELKKFDEPLFDFENPQNHQQKIYGFYKAVKELYNVYHLASIYVEFNIDTIQNFRLNDLSDEWELAKKEGRFWRSNLASPGVYRTFAEYDKKHPARKELAEYQEFKLVLSKCIFFYCYLVTLRVANSISILENKENTNFFKTESFREKYLEDFWIIILESAPIFQNLFGKKNRNRTKVPTFTFLKISEYKDFKKLLNTIQKFFPKAFNRAFNTVVQSDPGKKESFSFESLTNEKDFLTEHKEKVLKRQKIFNKQLSENSHLREILDPENLTLIFSLVSNNAFLLFSSYKKSKIKPINDLLKERNKELKVYQNKLEKYEKNRVALRRYELEFFQNMNASLPKIIQNLQKEKDHVNQFVKPEPTVANQKTLNELFRSLIIERRSWLILKDYGNCHPEQIEKMYELLKKSDILRERKKSIKNQMASSSNQDRVMLKSQVGTTFPHPNGVASSEATSIKDGEVRSLLGQQENDKTETIQMLNSLSELQKDLAQKFITIQSSVKNQSSGWNNFPTRKCGEGNIFNPETDLNKVDLLNSALKIKSCNPVLKTLTLKRYNMSNDLTRSETYDFYITLGPFVEINKEMSKKQGQDLIDEFNKFMLENRDKLLEKNEKIPIILNLWGSKDKTAMFFKQELAHLIPKNAFGSLGLTTTGEQVLIERGEELDTVKTAVYLPKKIHECFDKQNVNQIIVPKEVIDKPELDIFCFKLKEFLIENPKDFQLNLEKLKLDMFSYGPNGESFIEAFQLKNEIKAELLGLFSFLYLVKNAEFKFKEGRRSRPKVASGEATLLCQGEGILEFSKMQTPDLTCLNNKDFFQDFVKKIKYHFRILEEMIDQDKTGLPNLVGLYAEIQLTETSNDSFKKIKNLEQTFDKVLKKYDKVSLTNKENYSYLQNEELSPLFNTLKILINDLAVDEDEQHLQKILAFVYLFEIFIVMNFFKTKQFESQIKDQTLDFNNLLSDELIILSQLFSYIETAFSEKFSNQQIGIYSKEPILISDNEIQSFKGLEPLLKNITTDVGTTFPHASGGKVASPEATSIKDGELPSLLSQEKKKKQFFAILREALFVYGKLESETQIYENRQNLEEKSNKEKIQFFDDEYSNYRCLLNDIENSSILLKARFKNLSMTSYTKKFLSSICAKLELYKTIAKLFQRLVEMSYRNDEVSTNLNRLVESFLNDESLFVSKSKICPSIEKKGILLTLVRFFFENGLTMQRFSREDTDILIRSLENYTNKSVELQNSEICEGVSKEERPILNERNSIEILKSLKANNTFIIYLTDRISTEVLSEIFYALKNCFDSDIFSLTIDVFSLENIAKTIQQSSYPFELIRFEKSENCLNFQSNQILNLLRALNLHCVNYKVETIETSLKNGEVSNNQERVQPSNVETIEADFKDSKTSLNFSKNFENRDERIDDLLEFLQEESRTSTPTKLFFFTKRGEPSKIPTRDEILLKKGLRDGKFFVLKKDGNEVLNHAFLDLIPS